MDSFSANLFSALVIYIASILRTPRISSNRPGTLPTTLNRICNNRQPRVRFKSLTLSAKKDDLNNNINSQKETKNFLSKTDESKASLDITDDQDAIIFGSLLGDAHIQKRGNSYRLKIAHSSKQRAYVDWKHEKLESLCKTTQGVTERISSKNETTCEFYTQSNQVLKKYHDLFYQKQEKIVNGVKSVFYRKTITPELINSLPMNNYTLSTFYLDDGSARSDCYSGRFAIQSFSKDECHLLQEYFNKWDLTTSVVLHSREKNQYSLSIPAKTFPKFVEIVEKPIKEIPTMTYKLNEKNRNKSSFLK